MNSVQIIGLLRERIDDYYRNFEYELPFMEEKCRVVPRIVIRNWTEQPRPRLIFLEDGTRVALHGHLDAHEKFGTILVVEQIETAHK